MFTLIAILASFMLMHLIAGYTMSLLYRISQQLTGKIYLGAIITLPGTFLHELSHWLTAKLLFVDVGDFTIWPKFSPNGLTLGSVTLKEEVDPFRHSLIGIAPLIFGSLGVVIIGQGQLGLFELGSKLTQGDFQALSQWFSDVISSPWSFIMLYLVFVIANGMFPSYPSDRANWHVVLLYMAVVAIILIALGITPTNIPPQFGEFGYQAMIHLLVAFSITIFLDMIIIGPLLVIQTLLHLITGR